MTDQDTTPSIVVGVDGSKSGARAALWAADEAAMRGARLRVIYVVEEQLDDNENAAGAAQTAITDARTAIEATGNGVTVETEVLRGRPLPLLAKASASAAMVCIGPVGRHRIAQHRVGSTAAALASSAQCPVAIVRAGDSPDVGHILVDLDDFPADVAVLQQAMDSARLRQAPLEVVARWRPRAGQTDEAAINEGNQRVRAKLDRLLDGWTRRYPDVDVHTTAVSGSILDYLTKDSRAIQLLVVGAGAPGDAHELLSPPGAAVLRQTDCSVLVVARHNL